MKRFITHLTMSICAMVFLASTNLNGQAMSWTYRADVTATVDLLAESVTDTSFDLSKSKGELSNLVVSATNGELHVAFNMRDERPDEMTQSSFNLRAEFSLNGESLNIRPDHIYGDYGAIQAAGRSEFGFSVAGLLEHFATVAGVVKITIVVDHDFVLRPKIDFDCVDGLPRFEFKNKVPYIGGAVIGAGLITWGAVTEVDAKKLHDEYFNADGQADETKYNDANRQHKQAVGIMAAGGAILVASGVLYYVRHRDFKKRSYLYETYCQEGNSIGFNPVFEMPNNSIAGGSAGISLVYTF